MFRIAALIGALLAGLLVIPLTAPIAEADANCPTPANSYAGGSGTVGSPWEIATKEQFQRLRDDSITGWDDSYVLTANINMAGCVWDKAIGDSSSTPFTGKIDGDGHVVSGLIVSLTGSASAMYAGLVGYLGAGGIITELGFGGVVYAMSNNGSVQVFAGGLVGRAATGAGISYSYASSPIQVNLVSGNPIARVGGLVGHLDGGDVSNSYATGVAFVLGVDGTIKVGALIGELSAGTITKSYSSGVVTVNSSSATVNSGGSIGSRTGSTGVSDNFWDTTSSGTATGVGSGSSTGIVGKTTTQLQTFSTYDDSGWAITNGWASFSLASSPQRVWGVCAGYSRAYLLWQYASTPCPSTPSAPTITGITPGGTTASVAFTVDDTGNAALTRLEFAYDDTPTVDFWTNTVTSPATLTGLSLNTTYTVYMRVMNAQFTGPWSAPLTFTTLRKPGAPTITGVTPTLSSAQVAFTIDDSGGSPVTRLEFALDDTVAVDDSTAMVTSPYTVSGLASSTTYRIYMRAVNAQGTGPWSPATTFTTLSPAPPPLPPPPTPASAPRDVVATPDDAAITANWSPPASTGSFPVTQYKAVASPGGQLCLTSSTSCRITGLTNGVTYVVRVQALTGAGWSADSSPSNAVTPTGSVTKSITITGSRGTGPERRLVTIRGVSTGLAGERVTMWFSLGSGSPEPSKATPPIEADGTFTWSRRTPRAITVYAEADGVRSASVTVRGR